MCKIWYMVAESAHEWDVRDSVPGECKCDKYVSEEYLKALRAWNEKRKRGYFARQSD